MINKLAKIAPNDRTSGLSPISETAKAKKCVKIILKDFSILLIEMNLKIEFLKRFSGYLKQPLNHP